MRDQYKDAPTCYYCGEPASDADHVIPQSFIKHVRGLGDPELLRQIGLYSNRLKLVPACKECNSLLGSKYFGTASERKAYVQNRLRQRYRRLLEMPSWTDREIAELHGPLQRFIVESQALKERIERRVAGAPRVSLVRAPSSRPRGRPGRPAGLTPERIAATLRVAAALELLFAGEDISLGRTHRMGWILRRPTDETLTKWVDIDSAPDDQLGALLTRFRDRKEA